ncbi:MAG TPA: aminopeptidase P family protein [Prolixibacteraceae bacterium]|nr:aminopeptidase P family protein [Prolixibacteraceae bacterium]
MEITRRIADLRALMIENQIDAYLITGSDPHLSEYTPDRWKTREWISGFTGSYGKVLVTLEKALLWTDTRYFIQAAEELSGTEIELMKERVPDAISLEEWVTENLGAGKTVAIDGETLSAADAAQLESKFSAKGITFITDLELVAKIWINRPHETLLPVYEHEARFAGKSRTEKISLVRKMLLSKEIDSTVVSMLDEAAWLFNIRGSEINYTPLVTAYGYLDQENAWLFIHPGKLTAVFRDTLEKEGIRVMAYDQFYTFLSRINGKKVLADPLRSNSLLAKSLINNNIIDKSTSAVTLIKAVKDEEEIKNIRNAHIKDGIAMVHFLQWISQSIGKERITEVSAGNMLNEFRSRQPLFKGDSFHPIAGFGPHGAIVHYHATNQTDSEIFPDNLLLIDSGGQYLDGTTDITRTIVIGKAATKHKEDFTSCLKAHISLAKAIFPAGTKGHSLDSIARKPLWDKGINYGHGTGHGIGYFLSVHEGPMSIRAEFNNEPVREGHLLSNEPGIYRAGEYGIRIENVMLCKKYATNEFGDFLCFETISLCPVDRQLILAEMLNEEEVRWLNDYHETVYRKISPHIRDAAVSDWLKLACRPISGPE